MPKYSVTLPICGYAVLDVEAADEEAAIDKAMEEVTNEHIEEWESHRQIVQGNVFHGSRNQADAELINED